MTNHAALRELADRLSEQWQKRMAEYSKEKDYASAGVIGLVLMEFNALTTQLRTAASEGGDAVLWRALKKGGGYMLFDYNPTHLKDVEPLYLKSPTRE